MPFTSYSVDPNTGAYTFTDAGGASILAIGQAAKDKAREIDELTGPAPEGYQFPDTPAPAAKKNDYEYGDGPPPAPTVGELTAGASLMSAAPRPAPDPRDIAAPPPDPRDIHDPVASRVVAEPPPKRLEPGTFAGGRSEAAAAPPATMPAGLVTEASERSTQSTTTRGPKLSAADEKALVGGVKARSAAVDTLAGVEASRADRQAAALERGDIELANRDRQIERDSASQQAKLAQDTDKLRELHADYAKSNIDPDAFWGSRTDAQRVMAAIAVGLGAAGRGKGEGNAALTVIMGAVDRSIDAQKANLSKKRGAIEAQHDLLGAMRSNFSDGRQGLAAARMMALDRVNRELTGIEASTKSAEIRARAQSTRADLANEWAKAKAAFDQAAQGHSSTTTGTTDRLTEKGGKAGGSSAKEDERLIPDGMGGFVRARRAEDATKLREHYGLVLNVEQNVKRMHEIANMGPFDKLSPKLQMEYASAREDALSDNNTLHLQGVMRDDDFKRAENFLSATATNNVFDQAEAALAFGRKARQNYLNQVAAHGAAPVEESFARDPAGNLVRTSQYTGDGPKPALPVMTQVGR